MVKLNYTNIAIIIAVLVFLILLVYYLRRKEGYDLQELNVGNWKMKGTSDSLNVQGTEGKSVVFNTDVQAKSIKADSLNVTKSNGQGIIVDNDGNLHVYGKIFLHRDKNMPKYWQFEVEQTPESELVISRWPKNPANGKETRYYYAGECSRDLCANVCEKNPRCV